MEPAKKIAHGINRRCRESCTPSLWSFKKWKIRNNRWKWGTKQSTSRTLHKISKFRSLSQKEYLIFYMVLLNYLKDNTYVIKKSNKHWRQLSSAIWAFFLDLDPSHQAWSMVSMATRSIKKLIRALRWIVRERRFCQLIQANWAHFLHEARNTWQKASPRVLIRDVL